MDQLDQLASIYYKLKSFYDRRRQINQWLFEQPMLCFGRGRTVLIRSNKVLYRRLPLFIGDGRHTLRKTWS